MTIKPAQRRSPVHTAPVRPPVTKAATATKAAAQRETTFEAGKGSRAAAPGRAVDAHAFQPSAELMQFVAGQRQVAQAGGAGGTSAMKVAAGDKAAAAALELTGYTSAQLRKLDVVADGKLDAQEIAGIIRFADANDDGKIDGQEQAALDYLVGKDTSVVAAEAFVDLHEERLGARSAVLQREVTAAEAGFAKLDAAHDALGAEVSKMETDMRAAMSDEGIVWNEDPPERIQAEMAKLGPRGKLDARGEQQLHQLEVKLAYAEMRRDNGAALKTSYDAKVSAEKTMREARVENRAAQSLFTEAGGRVKGAQAVVVKDHAQALTSDMINLRDAVAHDPKIHGAFKTFAKATAIKNAVRDGKLASGDVDNDKVDDDIKSSRRTIEKHTGKMEKGAELIAKQLADPTFRRRLEALPPEEQGELLTDMHSLIADTKAGDQFFHEFILPGLKGKSVKRPEIYDDLKLGRHGTKLALNLLGVYGGALAALGPKESLQLMDAMIARAVGIDAKKVPKLFEAIEVMNKQGLEAGKKVLTADPELKAISGRLNVIAGGVAVASGILAASDLMRDPNLRTSLGAAKGAGEVAEVLGRVKNVPASVTRYSRLAGRVGPPLDMIIGGLDGYKALKRSDVAGAIGGFTQAAGGLAGTAGLIAAAAGATGVGLPLAVIGGVVATVGSLITAIGGDSPTEKWLKDNAPEYLD